MEKISFTPLFFYFKRLLGFFISNQYYNLLYYMALLVKILLAVCSINNSSDNQVLYLKKV